MGCTRVQKRFGQDFGHVRHVFSAETLASSVVARRPNSTIWQMRAPSPEVDSTIEQSSRAIDRICELELRETKSRGPADGLQGKLDAANARG